MGLIEHCAMGRAEDAQVCNAGLVPAARRALFYKIQLEEPGQMAPEPPNRGHYPQVRRKRACEQRADAGARPSGGERPNWSSCHIWGVDDAFYRGEVSNAVVRIGFFGPARRTWSCLPTPLEAFTDVSTDVKMTSPGEAHLRRGPAIMTVWKSRVICLTGGTAPTPIRRAGQSGIANIATFAARPEILGPARDQ